MKGSTEITMGLYTGVKKKKKTIKPESIKDKVAHSLGQALPLTHKGRWQRADRLIFCSFCNLNQKRRWTWVNHKEILCEVTNSHHWGDSLELLPRSSPANRPGCMSPSQRWFYNSVCRMLFHFQGSPWGLKTQLWPNLLCEFCALPGLSRGWTAGFSCRWLQYAPSRHHLSLLSICRRILEHVLITCVFTLLTTVICTANPHWMTEERRSKERQWCLYYHVLCTLQKESWYWEGSQFEWAYFT